MTSGGMYKYPVFEGTRISLSPKHKGSLKSFLKAILNIWEHCQYSTESSLAQSVVGIYNCCTPSPSGGKSYRTVAELQTLVSALSASALRSLCGPGSTLAYGRHLVSLYPSPVCGSLPVYQLSLVFLGMLLLTRPGGLLYGIQNSECRKEA